MGARESHGEVVHSHFKTHTEREGVRAFLPSKFPAFPVGSVCMLAMTGLPVSFHYSDTTNTFPNFSPRISRVSSWLCLYACDDWPSCLLSHPRYNEHIP